MEIISNIAVITINETLVVQMVSFLIFLFLINRIMFRPLRQTMAERDQYIDDVQKYLVESEKELEALKNQILEEEATVRSDAFRIFQEIEATGDEQAAEIFTAARNEVNSQIDEAKASIDAQVAEAVQELQKESESLANCIMEKLLDRKPS